MSYNETKQLTVTSPLLPDLDEKEDHYTRISQAATDFCKEWTWESAYCSKMIDLMTGTR